MYYEVTYIQTCTVHTNIHTYIHSYIQYIPYTHMYNILTLYYTHPSIHTYIHSYIQYIPYIHIHSHIQYIPYSHPVTHTIHTVHTYVYILILHICTSFYTYIRTYCKCRLAGLADCRGWADY